MCSAGPHAWHSGAAIKGGTVSPTDSPCCPRREDSGQRAAGPGHTPTTSAQTDTFCAWSRRRATSQVGPTRQPLRLPARRAPGHTQPMLPP